MTVLIGDIVQRDQLRWVVARRERAVAPRAVRLLRIAKDSRGGDRIASLLVSEIGLPVVAHPTFSPGEKVKASTGEIGTVLNDPGGESTVRVATGNRRRTRAGDYVTGLAGGEHDADRASLILENRKV